MDFSAVVQHVDNRIVEVKTDVAGHIGQVRRDIGIMQKDIRTLMQFKWKVTGMALLVGSGTAVVFEIAKFGLDILKTKMGGS